MKIQTLINGGSIVNPSSFKSFEHLKGHYKLERENWYPLFDQDKHKGQLKLETVFRPNDQWHVEQAYFKQDSSLWKYLCCGAVTCAAAGGVAYTVMDQ